MSSITPPRSDSFTTHQAHLKNLVSHADPKQYALPTEFVKRPGFNTTGKAIQLPVNSYAVTQTPTVVVYQYDVIVGNGAEKRVVQAKTWASSKRMNATGPEIIYDGNKLAWSLKKLDQIKIMIDLDEENGRPPSKDGKNAFRLHISMTKKVDLTVIQAYLANKIQFNVNVLEAVNFLDHLLRAGPSQNPRLFPIKRSFFARDGDRADLGGGVEVFRGIYQTMRVAQGGKLVVNLDVANTTFWIPQSLINTIKQKNQWRDEAQIAAQLKNESQRRATKNYLKKLSVKASYPGNPQPNTIWKIDGIAEMTPNQHMLNERDQTGKDTGNKITVTTYFKRKYNVNLQFPQLPLIRMTKKMRGEPIYFPMEFLQVQPNQRYGTKCSETQTANMIKFAVSPPARRADAINQGKSWLNWGGDKFINNYGLKIDNNQMVTQARILPPPGIRFGKGKIEQPGTKGRWDLRGKQFFAGNPTELVSWGIGMFTNGRVKLGQAQVEKFAMDFIKAYRGHGGQVANGMPHIMPLNADPGQAVAELHAATGKKFNRRPEFLVFILQDRTSHHYERIKKSCECRFGVVSQCMQAAQVAKGNPQYYSNVLMKVNAKLGGSTSQVAPHQTSGYKGQFPAPTVFIGADVSHASPGSDAASLAALTVSFDRHAGRYAAGVQTNGRRVEMITERNMTRTLGPLLQTWMSDVGGGRPPQQIYYMRDGVSEGQFAQVMQDEVPHIRAVMDKLAGSKWTGKLTVIVASKRHHIRAFPRGPDADQKGNPLPGTLIEKDITMPQEFDFYLYSHIALQGTSRPVHYTVLHDEANHPPSVIQNMIYEHCYQYMRSTTSVSQHPAVYYAHLASKRAVAHINVPATSGPQTGPGFKQNPSGSSDTPRSSEVGDLLQMYEAGNKIKFSMWYI